MMGAMKAANAASSGSMPDTGSIPDTGSMPDMGSMPTVGTGAGSSYQMKKKSQEMKRQLELTENLFRPFEMPKDNGILNSLSEYIWVEGCFSGKDAIKKNPNRDYHNGSSLSDIVYDLYYAISENPLFGWNEGLHPGPREWYGSIQKFGFCFLKITILFPFYLIVLILRFIYVLGKAILLMIGRFGAGVWNFFAGDAGGDSGTGIDGGDDGDGVAGGASGSGCFNDAF